MIIITTTAMRECSIIALILCFLSSRSKVELIISMKPQQMLVVIAVFSSKRRIGTKNVNAKMNFDKKVAIVDSQTFLKDCLVNSCDTWMPMASDSASAMAMLRTPPITTSLELVVA